MLIDLLKDNSLEFCGDGFRLFLPLFNGFIARNAAGLIFISSSPCLPVTSVTSMFKVPLTVSTKPSGNLSAAAVRRTRRASSNCLANSPKIMASRRNLNFGELNNVSLVIFLAKTSIF